MVPGRNDVGRDTWQRKLSYFLTYINTTHQPESSEAFLCKTGRFSAFAGRASGGGISALEGHQLARQLCVVVRGLFGYEAALGVH